VDFFVVFICTVIASEPPTPPSLAERTQCANATSRRRVLRANAVSAAIPYMEHVKLLLLSHAGDCHGHKCPRNDGYPILELCKKSHSILEYNALMHGKIIRELREEHNLSQQQLAEKLNTTQNTISKYETEVLDLSTDIIHKLCDIFNVSSDYLLGRKDYCD